jgi:hypothetical protein
MKIFDKSMELKTLQIATFGKNEKGIAIGVRHFPIRKLILIRFDFDINKAQKYATRIQSSLDVTVEVKTVTVKSVIRDTIQLLTEILKVYQTAFQQLLMNVSAGENLLNCAALCAAFIHGVITFGDDMHGGPLLMPIMKLSYNEMISEAKIRILKAIDILGGNVEGLERVEKISGYKKNILSYHIQGTNNSKGLDDLGLVYIKRGSRGKIIITLSPVGKLFATDMLPNQWL